MRDKSIGSTSIDVVVTLGVVVLVCLVVVSVINPRHVLAEGRDEVRVDGVRNIMEAILELQAVAPEQMDRLRDAMKAAGAPPRVMIGHGATCAGDWGVQCSDALLADGCVDAVDFLGEYLPQTPVDPTPEYSASATGYYLTLSSGTFEVGACNPELRDDIRL